MVRYGPILKSFLLKCQAKLGFLSKWGKYPSFPGKTKFTKVNFLINFVRALELEYKNVGLRLALNKNYPVHK
jgi:hypothetical protein